jgi:hypothetical protein
MVTSNVAVISTKDESSGVAIIEIRYVVLESKLFVMHNINSSPEPLDEEK